MKVCGPPPCQCGTPGSVHTVSPALIAWACSPWAQISPAPLTTWIT